MLILLLQNPYPKEAEQWLAGDAGRRAEKLGAEVRIWSRPPFRRP